MVQTGPTRRPRAIIVSKVERRCIWFLRCGVAFRDGHILGDRKGLQERINPEDLGGDVDYGAAYWMDDIRIRGWAACLLVAGQWTDLHSFLIHREFLPCAAA